MLKNLTGRAAALARMRQHDRELTYHALDIAGQLFGLHPRDISGPYRFRFCVYPRFAVFAALHACGMSQNRIAKAMNRDRKSIHNGLSRNTEIIKRDPFYAHNVRRMIEAMHQFREDKTQ